MDFKGQTVTKIRQTMYV